MQSAHLKNWLKVGDAPYHNTRFLTNKCMMMASIGGHAPVMLEAGPYKKQHSLHQKRVPKGMPLISFCVTSLVLNQKKNRLSK